MNKKLVILSLIFCINICNITDINAIGRKKIAKIGMASGACIAVVSGVIYGYLKILLAIRQDPFMGTDLMDVREEYRELQRNVKYSRNSVLVGLGILLNSWLLSKYK